MMFADLLNGFLQLVLDFVIAIVNIILLPIDALINNYFPAYLDVTSYITDMLNYALTYIGYIIDSLGLYPFTILFLVDYLIFKITVPLYIWVVKLAIRWYDNLKT